MAAWRSTLGGNLLPIDPRYPITGFDPHHQISSLPDPNNGKMRINLASEEDELMNCGEEGEDTGDSNMESFWPRVKWTDTMVKLLVTALSYINGSIVQKKGKWRSVSEVMAQRGFHVSPRQCEDKFNDLNKRYKKLNEVLGRGTTCMVVESPSLLDTMNLSDKAKEEVKKIMGSKHLFYEEMCSYHNGNRLFLPHDPDLHLARRSKDEEEDRNGVSVKRFRGMDLYEDACLGKHFSSQNGFTNRSLELEKMKLENECMRLEDERMALEIERKNLGANNGL